MKITLLVSSKSIGINSYTVDVMNLLCKKYDVEIIRIVPSKLTGKSLGEHILNQLQYRTGLLHIQHDSSLLRGDGDQWDEYETTEYLLQAALKQFDHICNTYHGITHDYYGQAMLDKIQQKLVDRYWNKQVLPLVRKCTNLVHSQIHMKHLESQGVNAQQILVPVNRTKPFPEFEPLTNPIKIVVPGRVKQYHDYDFIISMLNTIDCEYQLTIPIQYKHQIVPIQHLCDQYQIPNYRKHITGRPPRIDHTYVDELTQHDAAVVSYTHDIPHSGCIHDCVSNGVYTVAKSTPSVSQRHDQKYKSADTPEEAGEWINRVSKDIDLQRMMWYNMRVFRHTQDDLVMRMYDSIYQNTPEPVKQTITSDIYVRSKTIKHYMSRQYVTRPEIPAIVKWLYDNYDDIDIPDVEHYFTHHDEKIQTTWTGVLHGPTKNEHANCSCRSLDWLLCNSNLLKSLKTCGRLYVLCESHKRYITQHTDTRVELIELPRVASKLPNYVDSDRPVAIPGYYGTDFKQMECLDAGVYADDTPLKMAECLHKFDYVEQLTDDMFSTHKMLLNQQMDVIDDMMFRCIQRNTPFMINHTKFNEGLVAQDIINECNLYV